MKWNIAKTGVFLAENNNLSRMHLVSYIISKYARSPTPSMGNIQSFVETKYRIFEREMVEKEKKLKLLCLAYHVKWTCH